MVPSYWLTLTVKPSCENKAESYIAEAAEKFFQHYNCYAVAELTKRNILHYHAIIESDTPMKQLKQKIKDYTTDSVFGFFKLVAVQHFWGCANYMQKDVHYTVKDDLGVLKGSPLLNRFKACLGHCC